MPDLWGYKTDAIKRAVAKLEPKVKAVTLFSGLYAYVETTDGQSSTIGEYALKPYLRLEDLRR